MSATGASDERTEPAMTPQSTTPNLAAWADRPEHAGYRLRGRCLITARAVWLSLAGLALVVLVVPSRSSSRRRVRFACPLNLARAIRRA
jgi:hypothetical protein